MAAESWLKFMVGPGLRMWGIGGVLWWGALAVIALIMPPWRESGGHKKATKEKSGSGS